MGCSGSKKIAIDILDTIELTSEVINKLIKNFNKYDENEKNIIISKITKFYSVPNISQNQENE